ncbi:MAG: NAD+ synthase [Planctomycetaceae bacterium]|jgi:NAD+ synthase (glutamine-hydrolysing)
MRIALAQLNPIVGDLAGNSERLLDMVRQASAFQPHLLVAPELFLSGYPPKDLLLRHGFVEACDRAVDDLATRLPPSLGLLVGHPTHRGVPRGYSGNAASLIAGGRVQETILKCLLPNYDVFDERRYFVPAKRAYCRVFQKRRLGVHICEDAWFREPGTTYHLPPERHPDPVQQLADGEAELFINLSASPFEIDKPQRRIELCQRHVSRHGRPFLFVNQVGGNDDLVFDGNSLAMDATGRVVAQLRPFAEDLGVFELQAGGRLRRLTDHGAAAPREREADLLDALVLGLRDYARKSGFTDCVLGLSGGIDSAVAAAVAARALGPERVHGLALPSRHSSEHSLADARVLAERLGIDLEVVPIDAMHRAYEQAASVGADLASQPGGLADQNLQARIRGACVMTRSNRHGWLALATGNKSELAVGYCTLYGDMAGGFAVLADLFKRDVYALARYLNQQAGKDLIPESSLTKAPSAELAPNQFDQDTLPPYPVLDAILEGLVEQELSVAELAQQFPLETVRWVQSRVDRNEFKRRQMAPGIKLSARAFGTGRRMPMAARFDWEVPR